MIGSIGICGAHRTGKSTLAEKLAHSLGIPFVQTTTSQVFAEAGLDPSQPMDFGTRLMIQQKVLLAGEAVWSSSNQPFVSDRTPIDMMAYTLADIQGTTVVDFPQLSAYLQQCFASTNRFFRHLFVVQPGIPLVHAEGKAALNPAYIEHINTLIIGLCQDSRLSSKAKILPRSLLDLSERLAEIDRAIAPSSITE
jgi:hypothetical protein